MAREEVEESKPVWLCLCAFVHLLRGIRGISRKEGPGKETEMSDGDRIRFEPRVQNSVSVTHFLPLYWWLPRNPWISQAPCHRNNGCVQKRFLMRRWIVRKVRRHSFSTRVLVTRSCGQRLNPSWQATRPPRIFYRYRR